MVDYVGIGGVILIASCVGVILVAVGFEIRACFKEAKKRLDK